MRRTPNRVLDLAELDRPDFRKPIEEMKALTSRDEVSFLHPSKQWEYPWALERADLDPDSRILDAGCGASIFPVYLASLGYRVSAADLCLPGRPDRWHGVEVGYVLADLVRLPFARNSFDVVFCISVIEHLPSNLMLEALEELRRVLRPAGRLLMTTDFYGSAGDELWYEGPGEPFRVVWNVFDPESLHRIVLSAPGFRVIGDIDLNVDWEQTRRRMRRFHGYPYTAVGVALEKE